MENFKQGHDNDNVVYTKSLPDRNEDKNTGSGWGAVRKLWVFRQGMMSSLASGMEGEGFKKYVIGSLSQSCDRRGAVNEDT